MAQPVITYFNEHITKPHALQTKHEVFVRRYNGVTVHSTVLSNISTIAKDCNRPTSWLVKFLSIKNSTKAYLHEWEDRYLLYSMFTNVELDNLIDNFIVRYVICPICQSCETSLSTCSCKIFIDCKHCESTSHFWGITIFDNFLTQIICPLRSCIIIAHVIIAEEIIEDNDDEDWSVDTSQEAVDKRRDDVVCCVSALLLE